MTKELLRSLCELASTESDRKLINFAVCESQGLSSKGARNRYGIHNYRSLQTNVYDALDEAWEIRKQVTQLAAVKEKVCLHSIGLEIESESDSDSDCLAEDEISDCEWISNSESVSSDVEELSEAETSEQRLFGSDADTISPFNDTESSDVRAEQVTMPISSVPCTKAKADDHPQQQIETHIDPDAYLNKEATPLRVYAPDHTTLLLMLRENKLNWFAFVYELQIYMKEYTNDVVNQVLTDFAQQLSFMDLDRDEERSIEQSRQAFLHSESCSDGKDGFH